MLARDLIPFLNQHPDLEVEIITIKADDLSVKGVYKSWDGKIKITNYKVKEKEDK